MADVKYGNGIARVNVRFEGEQDPNRTHKKLLLVRQEANRSVRRNMSQKRATVHQRLALYSYLHISLAFTSAIRPHTSDIFQPYFACKDTPFLLISHAKTEDVISWKIDFTQVQKQNHSYDSTSPSCHTYVFYALTIKFFLNYPLL